MGPDGSPDRRREDATAAVRIMVRPVGSPLPLGFFAFGVAILVLSALELSWIGAGETHSVAVVILTFAGPAEALAAIVAYLSRDTAGATGLTVFTVSWFTVGVPMLLGPAGGTSHTEGVFLIALAAVVALLAATSFQAKPLFGALLSLATARFALTAIYQFAGSRPLAIAAGIVGLVNGAFALYGGVALLLEDVKQRSVLPIGRRGEARSWLDETEEEHVARQSSRVRREAGVRHQL